MSKLAAILVALLALAAPALAQPVLGAPAPDFRARDAAGRTRSLSEFRGRTVVLEWASDACPYTHKHYDAGNMQRQQAEAAKAGVVWLTVISDAPDSAGYMTPAQARAWRTREKSRASDILLDPEARVARAYEAKVTPHMFIIDEAGKLVYMGGIDDRPYVDPESLKGAEDYVLEALAELKAGKPISHPVTRPYGCSVKYASAQ
ncbi:redoxin domain-containing protein [Phenylobacterium soli]|uniref:Thioredoxin family protein n=1 Tax=Phenylobacterium soli TaxID=2170551 RepID=A0A328AM14_9CAUL|nr:redoxin domain-containing protein [Phenylobacterium soli]RAK53918.1 thioredoxin family protein [Phenylobacterium soli]